MILRKAFLWCNLNYEGWTFIVVDVDVGSKSAKTNFRVTLCKCNLFFNGFISLLFDSLNYLNIYFKFCLCRKIKLLSDRSKDDDWIFGFSIFLDFFSFSVWNSRIGHRVTVITIAEKLNEERSVFNWPIFGPFKCLSNFIDIISFNSEAGDNITSCVEFSIHGGSLDWCSHTILIVFTDEEGRKIP